MPRFFSFDRIGLALPALRQRLAMAGGALLLALAALLFAKGGDLAQRSFAVLVARYPYAPLGLTPALFVAVAWVTRRTCPEARGSGIPQVMAATHNPEAASRGPLVTLRTAIAKMILTVTMMLGGASTGREGPTVQVSAAIMVWLHRLLRVPVSSGVLIAGGAAGVAAAFNTPLAGVAFAIEELAAAYEQRVAVMVMMAVMIAGLVSLGVAGDYIYFGTMLQHLDVRQTIAAAPVAGVAGGLFGGLFSRLMLAGIIGQAPLMRAMRARPLLLAAACGLVVAAIGVATHGTTWGTSYEPTRQFVESEGGSLWFGPAKFATTLATALSGTPGGIFAPALATGAGLGQALSAVFSDYPAGAVVLLGMVGYFTGVVRAPLTAVIILSETTGSRAMILPLFATALIADAVSSLVCREKLYHGLSKPFLPRDPTPSLAP